MRRRPPTRLSILAAALTALCLSASSTAQGPPADPFLIHVLDDEERVVRTVEVMFNPKEYTIEKQAPWEACECPGRGLRGLRWADAESLSLAMELEMDRSDAEGDVRPDVLALRALVPAARDRHRPPVLRLEWGQGLDFRAVLVSVRERYTLFREDGVPLRAVVNARFTEYTPPEEQLPRTPRH